MLISTKITRRILLGLCALSLLVTPIVSFGSADASNAVAGIVEDAGEGIDDVSDRFSF